MLGALAKILQQGSINFYVRFHLAHILPHTEKYISCGKKQGYVERKYCRIFGSHSGEILPDYMASHPKRLYSSTKVLLANVLIDLHVIYEYSYRPLPEWLIWRPVVLLENRVTAWKMQDIRYFYGVRWFCIVAQEPDTDPCINTAEPVHTLTFCFTSLSQYVLSWQLREASGFNTSSSLNFELHFC
jgi:hypothetical protein